MDYTRSNASCHRQRRNGSRYHYREPRHKRSTMFRLGNNGDVLVLHSTKVDDPQTGRTVYPIRYYLIRHQWFLRHEWLLRTESRPHRRRAGRRKVNRNAWPSFRDVAGLQSARGLQAIDCILESQLFKSERFQAIWKQDAFNEDLGQMVDRPDSYRFRARFWSENGPLEEWWEGDKQEQMWMQKNLSMIDQTENTRVCTATCLGSVSNLPPLDISTGCHHSDSATSIGVSRSARTHLSDGMKLIGYIQTSNSESTSVVRPSYHLIHYHDECKQVHNRELDQEMRQASLASPSE
jgi:hypothetical protein